MIETMSLPLYAPTLEEYGGAQALRAELQTLGLHGIEGIWAGVDIPEVFCTLPIVGYHITFFPDWLDFYRQDTKRLQEKFGTLESAYQFYGGTSPDTLLNLYRADLQRAKALGAQYVVFHVSDVSIEEGYTYHWEHTHEEVLDTAIAIINPLLKEDGYTFDFLVENQWWPGFTFANPKQTEHLLSSIQYPNKGILLDTGHLMNTCTHLMNEQEGVQYIHQMLDAHGELGKWILGMHLHQSCSGDYVKTHAGNLPRELASDYITRFGESYAHILQIDQHKPWTDASIQTVIERISPQYLTHELATKTRAERFCAIQRQRRMIGKGGDNGRAF